MKKGASYLVRTRGREQWTTQTIRGPRRVCDASWIDVRETTETRTVYVPKKRRAA